MMFPSSLIVLFDAFFLGKLSFLVNLSGSDLLCHVVDCKKVVVILNH
jgi:hypothetical protein